MPTDLWFPLMIYYADLEESAAHKDALVEQVHEFHRLSGAKRTADTSAWTGDIHNVERVHCHPAFAWVTAQVEQHVLSYLSTLAIDLNKVDVYIQRAWPVISARGQYVARHAHHNAHISAVYYVSAPPEGGGGEIRFFNEGRPNEISGGLSGDMTAAYNDHNFTNFQSAIYRPIEGRLLVFPSKQPHAVDAHQSDAARISISYDLVITSREDGSPGLYEFLMPPPSQWKRIPRAVSEAAAEPEHQPVSV